MELIIVTFFRFIFILDQWKWFIATKHAAESLQEGLLYMRLVVHSANSAIFCSPESAQRFRFL